jgi:hypothetical protein
MKYTREQMLEMPLSVLRGLNIESPEEEVLVQEVVNERVARLPVLDDGPSSSLKTDSILSPEIEAQLQAEIDAKRAQKHAPVAEEEVVSQETADVVAPFCDTCDAKGPIKHKKDCPKSK